MSGTLRRLLPGLSAALIMAAVVAGIAYAVARVLRLPGRDPAGDVTIVVAFSSFAVAGALIVARRPGNRIGWLFAAIGLLALGFAAMENASETVAQVVAAGGKPGPVTMTLFIMGQVLWYPLLGLVTIVVPLLFPTGRAVSPRWALVGWFGMACLVGVSIQGLLQERFVASLEDQGIHREVVIENPIGILPFENAEEEGSGPALLVLALVAIAGSWISAVVRYRRAHASDRLQIKWVTWAVSLLFGWFLVGEVLWVDVFGQAPWSDSNLPFAILLTGVPVAAGIAIFRYRLYEIDRIISRTVTYGLVAGVLAAVYAGGVFLVQGVIGAEGDLAVAASTLAAFALFAPLRRRVQRGVDRRFNRSRYDAALVVEGLASKLRDRVELEVVTAELVGAARSALQPATVAVWVREQ